MGETGNNGNAAWSRRPGGTAGIGWKAGERIGKYAATVISNRSSRSITGVLKGRGSQRYQRSIANHKLEDTFDTATTHLLLIDADVSQKDVLDIFTRYAGAKSKLFDFSGTLVKGNCNFREELFPYSFLAPVRSSQAEYIGKLKRLCPDLKLIYSMWQGYLTGTPEQCISDIQHIVNDIFGGQYIYLHTSGHADVDTIRKVCEITKPQIGIISIHHDPYSRLADVLKNETRIIDESVDLSSYNIEYKEYN